MSSKRWRSCKVEVDVGLFTMGYMVYPLANHHIPYGWPFIAHSQTELIFFSAVSFTSTGFMKWSGEYSSWEPLFEGLLSMLEQDWGCGPTDLMGFGGASLGVYVGNLQILWGPGCRALKRAWGCMFTT